MENNEICLKCGCTEIVEEKQSGYILDMRVENSNKFK